jgi:hypothetical protein
MTPRRRFLIGAVGGLAPVIVYLISGRVDVGAVGGALSVGYLLRALGLFIAGGVVAYLHSDEHKPYKIFELGMAAPALLAGTLQTAQLAEQQKTGEPAAATALIRVFLPVAAADDGCTSSCLKHFTLPNDKQELLLQGLVGKKPTKVWFVIVGSHLTREEAQKQADAVNARHKGFHADVYAPYGENPDYAVVIGANLSQPDARALRDRARQVGLAKDAYFKTFPNLPPPESA